MSFADIDAVADRIARALPATIDGRAGASEDQKAMHRTYASLKAAHPEWSFFDVAHAARKAWVKATIEEGVR